MAKLTAVYGPMFAGKTTWILDTIARQERLGEKLLVIKPRLDDRYGKEAALQSHNGQTGQAVLVDEKNPQEILGIWTEEGEQHSVIVIDEVMFFAPVITQVIKEMLARGLDVIVAGLDTDYKKEPFGIMPKLIGWADERIVLQAKCYKCAKPAAYTARLSGGEGLIEVGASDHYQPACENCHIIFQEAEMGGRVVPALRPTGKNGVCRIEVAADSMRVGKTTAVQVIAGGLRAMSHEVVESYEDWEHNPYLKGSYSDPAKNFLDSQKWFIERKWQQIKGGARLRRGSGEVNIFIQDVAPEMDYGYAVTSRKMGRMSIEHFAEYDKYYRSLDWSQAPLPDLLVYLRVSDKGLIERANLSRRKFETVDDEYFLEMKISNRAWLKSIRGQRKILEIDTDKLNYADDVGAREDLVTMVAKNIGLL